MKALGVKWGLFGPATGPGVNAVAEGMAGPVGWAKLAIDGAIFGIGVVGFVLSFGWGKVSGRTMDRDATLFLVKIWSGIAAFGMVLAPLM